MKKLSLLLSLAICFCSLAFFGGCAEQVDSLDCYYFNTQIHLEVYQGKLQQNTKDEIKSLLRDLEKEFSVNNSTSFTSRFNSASLGESFAISQRAQLILGKAQEYYEWTDKKFNPAVYPLSTLWQFSPTFPGENFTPPTTQSIDQLLTSGTTDFESVLAVKEGNIEKLKEGAKIDFGGLLKGYACDKIAEILLNEGFSKGYVNVGGSSLRLLNVSSLGIVHPRKNGQIISIKSPLVNLSVSTSGDYQRFYEYQGNRYSHVIDSQTGAPSQTGVQSATVVLEDGCFADAVSTALCLLEYKGNQNDSLIVMMNKIISQYPSAQIYVAIENQTTKSIVTNKKKGVDFTLLDTSYSVVEI